jgi:methylated-DNA-[protein]-cysteine S-methyltransferase
VNAYLYYDSPLGRMLLVADDDAVCGVYFAGQKYEKSVAPSWRDGSANAALLQCRRELAEYFDGTRTEFTFATNPRGTPFARAVWREIARVPYGQTITYGELARAVGGTANPRAVGFATGHNPVSVAIPCHRIVGANGSLTGYAGGLDKKSALLTLESRRRYDDTQRR